MKRMVLIGILLLLSISSYAQGAQENYTLLLLDFEDKTGIENPLLAMFNDAIDFGLSRQTGLVQVRLVTKPLRDALLMRAAAEQPDKSLLEQGLQAAELVNADGLITGSYTKQGDQWSLEAQVYHRREGSRKRQEIQIQGDSVYYLLDNFPARLLQQFTDAGYVSLTTNSWKAYEEFRKGHQEFENYNFFGALEYYDKALALDPTLALAYAEKCYVYSMTGQFQQATAAIAEAKKWMPKASPMEQLAIRSLDYFWDSEQIALRELSDIWNLYDAKHILSFSLSWPTPITLAPGGVWDEPLLYQISAFASMQEGKRAEAVQHHEQWFRVAQIKTQAYPADALLLHQAAIYCVGIEQYLDEAIAMELKAIELNTEAKWREERYVLSRLYELKGDTEQSLEWLKKLIQRWPDPRSFTEQQMLEAALEGSLFGVPGQYILPWIHLAVSMREGKISPERLLRWCEDMLSIPDLHQPFRIHTKFLLAEVHQAMNDDTKMEAMLAEIGAPRESDWMVLGPIETSMIQLFPVTPPFAELFTDLTATHVGFQGQQIKWEIWEDERPLDGLINVWEVFNRKYYGKWVGFNFPTPAIVYHCIYVRVPAATDVQIHTGSSLMRVWLNENLAPVVQVNAVRPPILDKELDNVSLAAGLNRLLVATVSSNSYCFFFRITDSEGNPVPGLEFVSAKEVPESR